MYICNNWYVLYVLVDCQLAWLKSHLNQANQQPSKITTRNNCCIYTLLLPDDGQQANPKHVHV
jgi:hypothetical protein